MSERDDLLAIATERRQKKVPIGKKVFHVREVNLSASEQYQKLLPTDRAAAMAAMLLECVVDANGAPYLSNEDALKIADARRVAVPLMEAITEISGDGDGAEEKKD